VASAPLIAASLGGALLIVLVFLIVFVGAAYGMSRRGGGVDSHPGTDESPRSREED
jgi:hypothetical protein